MDFRKPQFEQQDVISATGIDASTLQTWATRRLVIAASDRANETGKKRLYSAEDCVWIALQREVTKFAKIGTSTSETWFTFGDIMEFVAHPENAPLAVVVSTLPPSDLAKLAKRSGVVIKPGSFFSETRLKTQEAVDGYLHRAVAEGHIALVVPTRKLTETTITRLEEILQQREADFLAAADK